MVGLAVSACSSASGGATPDSSNGAFPSTSQTSQVGGPNPADVSGTAGHGTSPTATDGPSTDLVAADGIGPDGCVNDYAEGTDYFPNKVSLEYAKNFHVTYHDSYATVTVTQPSPGAKPETYVLVRCGTPAPSLTGNLVDAQQVSVPVTSLFSGSTTQLPALVMLDRLDALTGVASKALISEKKVLERVTSPDVVEYADAAGTVDAEKVVAAKPDVVITGGMTDPAYVNIEQAGIPVIADADWLETSPLGRAEWIKLFAVLTDTAPAANSEFGAIVDAYDATAKKVAGKTAVPVVWGAPYQGSWYVPGGHSYAAELIADAGGTYPWADTTETGSIPTDVETVFAKSGTAPVWLANTTWTSTGDMVAQNSVLGKFDSFTTGAVWNAVKDVTDTGANNYYELGAARPDLVLGDLAAILHPDQFPNHDFSFYLKLK